jgi:opacity protein-like surface antigen
MKQCAPCAVLLALTPGVVHAEGFADFYFGAALTHETTVRFEDETTFPATFSREDADIDPSFDLGLRFGYYIDPFPYVGFAFDTSWFTAEGDAVRDNDVVPFSFLFMLRATIDTSPEFPYGRFQPYAGVGPSIVFYDVEYSSRSFGLPPIHDSDATIGLDTRAGFTFLVHRNFGLFIEYRYTYFRAYADNDDEDFFFGSPFEAAASFNTHHFYGGFTFRF